ncbi:MAG: nucleoside triphosphate pyrophosphohydrolase, partial [Streptosporangiaceae bacterium]
TIDDVADAIIAKLTRRHPHVFGDVQVAGSQEVTANWDAIKAAEREAATGGPGSALDGVPLGQPALALAAALQRRAHRAGAPEDLAELETDPSVSKIGAELFTLTARARAAGLDPEQELRHAARAYRRRVREWEHITRG